LQILFSKGLEAKWIGDESIMERPNYYAIIPAEVRYSNIKPNAKLLFGEITALTNKKGYCFASNNYFANLYGVSKNTVSLWITELRQRGFVSVEVIYENKQVKERRISITIFNERYNEKKEGGVTKKNEDNNTRLIKNIILRKREFENEVLESDFTNELCAEFILYWTELNRSKTKMRFEMERTWNTIRRLGRWKKNNESWSKKPHQKSRLQTSISAHKNARQMIENINNNNNK